MLRTVEHSALFEYAPEATVLSCTARHKLIEKARALRLGEPLQRVELALQQVNIRVVPLLLDLCTALFTLLGSWSGA